MTKKIWAALVTCAVVTTSAADPTPGQPASDGIYRLPYANETAVKVFDDTSTHRPRGRIDFFAVDGQRPFRVVAAARGRIRAIQDSYKEKQTGRAAADCRNNFVWVEHDNGEWTNYSHLAHGSVTKEAKRKVGDWVEAGDFIGIEGTVGCSMLDHVHFEVATPDAKAPFDIGGFLLDNEGNKRLRTPRFCNVAEVIKESIYHARPCGEAKGIL